MPKALSSWFGLSLCTLGYFCTANNPASAEARLALEKETSPSLIAQVTSDDTVNTQVTENGNTAEITGGETRGDNLFHSFQDFSIETGNEAAFLNADDIANIFSRVTGGNISNIDGLISANGSANLFLINPAGIIFGENARLDVGGSFYGSSASSILFEDGEFSATDLDNPPLLTINAPIGLNLRDQPGDIVNRALHNRGMNSS
jgi:filamentous hemagglutinin family protein